MSSRRHTSLSAVALATALVLATGCADDDPCDGATAAGCGGGAAPPDHPIDDGTDPEKGEFTLDEALADLPDGGGPLRATIETEKGAITCELFPNEAPIGVANFVGLARGVRPWKDPETEAWVKRPFYDGLIFHRVIDDFVAQGGDPLGTGYGGPGYEFVNEISDLKHEPGTLAYANAGPDTNGSQIYITEVALPDLDGGYTVFGRCAPLDVISAITATPTDSDDRPLTPIHTQTVTIAR